MPYIQRAITPILKQRVSTSKCMLLVGARQVGKSTLIKHEFEDFNRANFDDRLTRMQAEEEPKLFFLNNPKPLFIDEVQKVGGKKYPNCGKTGGGKKYGLCTNANSINIELCDTVRDGKAGASAATIQNALTLTHKLMKKYNIDKAHVIRHFDVTGKPCPAYWVDDKKWKKEFLDKL